jgi:hypothetical protein
MDWMVERNGFELPVPLGFLTESRVLWQFRFLRERRSALTEKEERTGSGLLLLEQAEPAVRIHSAPPSSPKKLVPLFADRNSPSREGNGEETKDRASEHQAEAVRLISL